MDIWSKKKRSAVMSRILSHGTGPEIRVRKMVRGLGCHFRVNVQGLPGKPDIVLPKQNRAIFIHGCFWHLHSNCIDGRIPKTRTAYWKGKLLANRERDKKHLKELHKNGWEVIRFWECEVEQKPNRVLSILKKVIQ